MHCNAYVLSTHGKRYEWPAIEGRRRPLFLSEVSLIEQGRELIWRCTSFSLKPLAPMMVQSRLVPRTKSSTWEFYSWYSLLGLLCSQYLLLSAREGGTHNVCFPCINIPQQNTYTQLRSCGCIQENICFNIIGETASWYACKSSSIKFKWEGSENILE